MSAATEGVAALAEAVSLTQGQNGGDTEAVLDHLCLAETRLADGNGRDAVKLALDQLARIRLGDSETSRVLTGLCAEVAVRADPHALPDDDIRSILDGLRGGQEPGSTLISASILTSLDELRPAEALLNSLGAEEDSRVQWIRRRIAIRDARSLEPRLRLLAREAGRAAVGAMRYLDRATSAPELASDPPPSRLAAQLYSAERLIARQEVGIARAERALHEVRTVSSMLQSSAPDLTSNLAILGGLLSSMLTTAKIRGATWVGFRASVAEALGPTGLQVALDVTRENATNAVADGRDRAAAAADRSIAAILGWVSESHRATDRRLGEIARLVAGVCDDLDDLSADVAASLAVAQHADVGEDLVTACLEAEDRVRRVLSDIEAVALNIETAVVRATPP